MACDLMPSAPRGHKGSQAIVSNRSLRKTFEQLCAIVVLRVLRDIFALSWSLFGCLGWS